MDKALAVVKILVIFIIIIFLSKVIRNKLTGNVRMNTKILKNQTEVKSMSDLVLNAKIVTNKGNINLKLFPEVAPMTVLNFAHLAKRGYYDNLKFHRVIADFMIQGGDPTGTGAGGPGYQFGDEFKEGVVFDRKGLLAMANAGKNTNGSQFFITHVETPWLNYHHTIFGEVVSDADQDIVNKIAQGDTITTIEITGDFDKFLTEENKKMTEQIDEILNSQFKNLRTY